MFGFGKKKNSPAPAAELISPVEGQLFSLAEVPDPAFSGGALGPGFAVDTQGNQICAPISGKIIVLFPTGHAFAIRSESGVEVLVHIGVDTVGLKGEGFEKLKAQGDEVTAGEPVVKLTDPEHTKTQVPSLATIVVVSNAQKYVVGEADLAATPGNAVVTVTEK